MSRELPAHPNLEHLKKQAKRLLDDARKGNPDALQLLHSLGALPPNASPRLVHAQHAIARDYGFASWPKLHARIEASAKPFDPLQAMHAAATAGDVERVAQLLEQHSELKANINGPLPGGSFGATPLLAALPFRNRDLIDVLLRAGADINQKSHWWAGGFGVLDSEHGLNEFLIERGAIVDVHAAARLGMRERLEELLDATPELVHARGGDGKTPLHWAANVEIASLLLERGADLDARDIDHESTPAQYLMREHPEVTRFLVSRGATTDLFMAAALGDLALIRKYLDADPASVEATVSERSFPKRNPRSGGTIYIWVLGGNKSPHAVAREFGHEDAFALLMERSGPEVKLAVACEVGDATTFQALLAREPGLVRSLSKSMKQKLVAAADNNHLDAVRLMLGAGWPVDVPNEHGATALHFAAWHGNAEAVRELLRHHAPLEVREGLYDMTPLRWAFHGSQHCWHPEISDYAGTVTALLAAGAAPPRPDDEIDASEAVREVLRTYTERR